MSDKPSATRRPKKDGSGSAKSTPRPSKPKASKKGKEGPIGGLSAPIGMSLPSLSLPPPDGTQPPTAQSSLSTLDGAQAALNTYGPEQLKADEALLQQLAALMQPLAEAARMRAGIAARDQADSECEYVVVHGLGRARTWSQRLSCPLSYAHRPLSG